MLSVNRKHVTSILLVILTILGTYFTSYAAVTAVSERTPQVRDAIIAAAGVNSATDVTETHLAAITSLNLRTKGITALKSGDFSGMTGLTNLNLYNNQLSSLPDGIFEGLTALTTLRLGGNTVDPLPITVSLEKVSDSDGQFKAVVPTGAPFDIVLPISAMHASIADSTTTLTISKGSVQSDALTVTRTDGTTAAVTANIGTLPSLPSNHYGYTLSKPGTLPLEVIGAVAITTPVVPDPVEPPVVTPPMDSPIETAVAPVFTDGTVAIRSVAENTAADVNIGTAIAATDANDDTLTWTLGGTDAAAFEIDSSTGQLKTVAALDYETKRIYTVTITASDGSLTDTINVIISIIDVADTPLVSTLILVSAHTPQVRDAIVAAIPGITSADAVTDAHLAAITSLNLRSAGISELKSGDFSGLTGLTNLNLYGNMLSSLPSGIFEGLTSLTTLRLGGNLVDPMSLPVSLQQVGGNQFKAVIPTGATFDIVLPINDSTMITIPKGSVTSASFTDVGTPSIGSLPALPPNHFGYILAKSDVCNRTFQVAEAIAAAVPGVTDCRNVSDIQLATITTLDLSGMSITSLDAGDFAGLFSLTTLNLSDNQLTSLPDVLFGNLPSLTTFDLSGNSVSPFPITVSLQKVGGNMLKTVVSTGAPFDMVLPIIIKTGNSITSTITLTIPQGSVESQLGTVMRTASTTAAITADIGVLPSLPTTHTGYAVTKSANLPVEVFSRINSAPVFTDGNSTVHTISENTAAGVDIGTAIAATDVDDDDTLTYTLGGTDASSFDIVNTSGQLQTKAALDYEKKTSYSVTVTVSDGALTDSISVTINVTDIDENRAPVFTDGTSTTRSIAENTAAGKNIGKQVAATDADSDTLTYSLGGTDASVFAIDTKSGQLKTSTALDFETKTSYSVTITVSDGKLTDTISVTIGVTDVDEKPATDDSAVTKDSDTTLTNNAPEFTAGSSITLTVAENTGSGVNIGSAVTATDADGHTLTYTLGGTDASSFSIDSTNGQLRTDASLDYEEKSFYSVTITVSDSSETDAISVTINVNDVNETPSNNAPVFTDGTSTTRSVAENTFSGVDIGSAVGATDADDDTLTYSLGGTHGASFSIDSTNGQLRTSDALDYETETSYSVTITVSDGNGGSDSVSVTINVIDVDEASANNAPVFADDSVTLTVAEDTGSAVNIGSAITATEADDDTLTYSLGGADAASFSIDTSSGQLETSGALDYESKSSYSVTVIASDGTFTDSISVTISVTNVNEAPVFTDGASTTRAIAENIPADINIGTKVAATDVDKDTLIYTLGGTDAASFSIDGKTGQLKTKAILDYETEPSYSVTITVSDGSLTDTIAVIINVTNLDETPSNNAPVFTDGTSTTRSVAENTAADSNIGTAISATDADNNTLAYLLSGADASAFSIDSTNGQLKTSAALDHETKDSYTVTVTVSDGSGTDSITATISVTDVNEAPIIADSAITTLSIAEHTVAGVNIGGTVSATDPDDGDTLTYTLGGTDASSFSIVSTSGQLQTKAALDYENKDSYSVTITVSDGTLTDTIDITITITDIDENRAPVFNDGETVSRSVAENTGSGVDIGSAVAATDADDDTLTWTLGGTNGASFSINSTNGQLRTKSELDYESETSYSVTVTVSDGKLTDTISVTINVTDVDENRAPVFTDGDSTTRSIAENTGTGVDIGSAVSATDADNNTLTYSLGGTDAASFSINSTNGQLRTKAELDYENKTSYTVIISVSDDKLTDSITVTINVTDVDENRAPVFTDGDSATRSIAENTVAGVNIGSAIGATDADDDTLEYTLGGTDADSFSIVSTSGQLQTKASLDYEMKNSYTVTISVSDGNGGSDSITVTINVTDVDENNAPVFTDGDSTTRSIAENTVAGVNIGDPVSATDADSDTLTYTLGGTDAATFSIIDTSGQLQTKNALNYEQRDTYSVTIAVSDGNGGSDSIAVTINITNIAIEGPQQIQVNSAPTFTEGDTATRSVAENTASGVNIGSPIAATDTNSGDTLTWTLGGTNASSFSIDDTSGQLQTSAELNYEAKISYTVTVSVSDGRGGTDIITVTINVTDVDEGTTITPVSDRTSQVQDAIVAAIDGVDNAADVTDIQLAAITSLSLNNKSISSLQSGDFSGMTSLAALYLQDNSLSSLPSDVFDGLSSLSTLNLKNNSITDVSVLEDVTSLQFLFLAGNSISDFRPLHQLKANSQVSIDIDLPGDADNNQPLFIGRPIVGRLIAENTAAGVTVGTITATDADDDTMTYMLGGRDADAFTLVTTTGEIQTKAALDYETKTLYVVTVSVSDGNGGTDSITVHITVTNVNEIDPAISARTSAVKDAIVAAIDGVNSPSDVIETQLAAITELRLVNKSISSLQVGDFAGMSSLEEIFLQNNSISSLPEDIFDGLSSLEFISLLNNSIASLPEDIFDGLSSLEELLLGNNSISSLPEDVFDGLSSLEDLWLESNSISSLPEDVFDGLSSLEFLRLNDNSIASLPEDVFDGLSSLETLELKNNSISSLPEDVFDGLSSLKLCLLEGNSISSVPEDIFDGLSSLTNINLKDNSVTSLSEDVFDGLSSLTHLHLQNNSLTSLPEDVFDGLSSLIYLYLEDNSLSSLSADIFDGLSALQDLYLEDNDLTSLPSDVFDDLTALKFLFLTNNSITDVSAVEGLTSLLLLYLEGNSISDYGPLRRLKAQNTNIIIDIEIPDENPGNAPTVQTHPDSTALLSNYPNPFNPETWIPYQLAKPSDVAITIYNVRGKVVRELDLGHQSAGFYTNRGSAAHWDGRNESGERVANGIYFYQLQAGSVSFLRKMVILK